MGARRPRSGMAGRLPMRSPGRPPVARREHRQRFWKAIAPGCPARTPPGVSGCRRRWGRGGSVRVAACRRPVWPRCRAATCRSPSEKRSPILKAQGCGVREIARQAAAGRLDDLAGGAPQRRDPWRAAGVSGHDRAVARRSAWHGGRRWPSWPPTTRCGQYVQDRLAGRVTRARRGRRCPVPTVRWIGRRHGRRKDRRWATSWSPEQIADRLPGRLPR